MKKKRLCLYLGNLCTKKIWLAMRLTLFLTLATSLTVLAGGFAQNAKLTLKFEDRRIKEILNEIENQTQFSFMYDNNRIDVERRVNLDVSGENIDEVLRSLFAGTTVTYKMVERHIMLISGAEKSFTMVQNGVVNGKVTNAQGEPLPGVTVLIKGTTNGTITDLNGNFNLGGVNASDVLVFSFIGMQTQEMGVGSQTAFNVVLKEETIGVDEVVVVGYGVQKRSDITGSVTSIPSDRLSKLPVNNVMQAIQGAAAGVNISQASSIPGDAPSVLVRGKNSISSSTEPYVVVDGIPLSKTGGSINDINPNDIESMEILKDPSAVAIYGVNGSNGVILITTKRGKSGKPVIRYSGYGGVEEIAHILDPGSPEQILERYAEYARIQNSSLYNGGPVRYEYEYDNYTNGKTTDWIDAVTQTGIIQNHNISITGGSEYSRYFISTDYMDQKGVVKGYNYKRYSFRTNADVDVTKYLTVGTSTFIVSHNRDGGRANLVNAAAMSPYARMYEEDGSLTHYPMYSETLWANPLLPTTLDPERRQFNISVNGYAEMNFGEIWAPLSGLKYKFNAGYSFVPYRTNEYEGKSVFNMTGWGRIVNRETQTYTIENILSYSKDINKHHFDFTGLYAAKNKYYQEAIATGSVFPNDDLGWGKLGAASTQTASSFADEYSSLSQMGRLNYSYDSRYLFTATVRRDGASVFGDNNKYAIFPSFAVGWNIANEGFMKPHNNVVNNLKLRLSYGKSGNEAIGVYQSLFKMDSNSLAMGGKSQTTLKVQTRMGNKDLSWETTKGFNTGLDFGFWNNRVNGSLDVYSTRTSDLLLQRSVPQITGYVDVYANIGKTKNTGVEFTINSKNVVTKDFTWGTTLVFARNKNKIVDLYGDGKDDLGNRWFIGHPVGVIYDYTKVGIWQEDEIAAGLHSNWDPTALAGDLKLADISGPGGVPDGKVDDNDRSILGQTDPKWTGGITNTFSYKNFSLSIFITTVQGALRNNSQIGAASDELGRRNGPAEVDYWTPENKSNEWRSLGNHSNSHGYGFPKDASYTRIKDIILSYNLPTSAISKIGINGLQLYLSGRNLYTFTNWIGWDPEARDLQRGWSESSTVDWSINYPVVRSFIFGINLTL
ncbi:TonB-dependent receptor [Gaoshiqia sp. Z1-71]|uniref:TonB-dependent receptor n=1 Tax=Gaoshiqia hydrogeniformans TaxID=3290090 RepID=UPI003BF8FDE3